VQLILDPVTARPPEEALSDDLGSASRTDGLDLEQQVCFGLSIAARGVVAAYRPLLEPLGLTHPQYLVMVSLWQHGPQTVKQLGSQLMLDSGTVSPLLKRLEGLGHVRRTRSGTDERQVVVELTEQGARLRADAVDVHDEVVRRLGLSQDELAHLQSVLEQLIEATARTTARALAAADGGSAGPGRPGPRPS
jgi:MarR family transcriptional regulator, organic hydroperoxide resistance regulator